MQIVALIPAYRPGVTLLELVGDLVSGPFGGVVIVDDGSGPAYAARFEEAERIPGVRVLHHEANRGKGAALKTGLKYILGAAPQCGGVVTADADGQHRPEDIAAVAQRLEENPGCLVMGAREFGFGVPWRSRTGNRLTSAAVRWAVGERLSDTQTGLRGIPRGLAEVLLDVSGDRFDFELEMLLAARARGYRWMEQPIRTVYRDGNRGSHFLPGRDSVRIIRVLVRSTPLLAVMALPMMILLTVYGVLANGILAQTLWSPAGLARLEWVAGIYAAAALAVWLWWPGMLPAVVAAAMLVFTLTSVGFAGPAAAALFLVAALAAGDLLVRASSALEALLAVACGTALYTWAFGIMAHFPVNRPVVWLLLLVVPVAVRWRRAAGLLRVSRWKPARAEYAAAALAGFVMCAHWLVALNPEISADGLAMHLAIPAYVAEHFRWSFDFRHFAWAVMPMNGDWAYSIVYLLGGEPAAHLLNFGLLLVLAGLLLRLCRGWLPLTGALLATGAFLSTPLVQLETGSLFVENLWALLLVGAVAALARYRETGERRFALLTALLLGAAWGTKFGALPFIVGLAPFWAAEMHRRRHGIVVTAGALVLFAAPPYVFAWICTGNPLFPFVNQVFHSPWLPLDTRLAGDGRFPPAPSWRLLWDATFHSVRFLEGQNGSLGFAWLPLVPPALLLLRRKSPYLAWISAAVAFVAVVSVFATQAYLRYIYPALPLLALLIALLLARVAGRRLYGWLCAGLAAVIGLNIYCLPSSGWYHRDFFALPGEREQYIAQHAPERQLIEYVNRVHPGQPVAFLNGDPIAGLRAPAFTFSWHTPEFYRALLAAGNPDDVLALARRYGIRYFIAPAPAGGSRMAAVVAERFLVRYTVPEHTCGAAYLARLEDAAERRDVSLPAPAGDYDDRDRAIEYTGGWWRDDQWLQAWKASLTYSDEPGAECRFRFAGNALVYRFTRAANRGMAEIRIDGQLKGTLDLYAAQTVWQAEAAWAGLGPGTHTITIRVLPSRHPASHGNYVDLDGFTVR